MTDDVRPDWRSIRRAGPHPTAAAARDATCSHGREVLTDEPIVLIGATTDVDPDGHRTVDLTGADWHPQQCLTTARQEAAA